MNNPLSDDPRHALYPWPAGSAGARLYEMLREVDPSVTRARYLYAFERINLVVGSWDIRVAREVAEELRPRLANRRVALLGREVARAFGLRGDLCDEWKGEDGIDFYLLPHPSGRNLVYNDPDKRLWAGRVLSMLCDGREVLSCG